MANKRITLAVIFFLGILIGNAYAQQAVPQLINYQGRLTDAEGNGLTGTQTIIFNIYDADSGGNLIWGPQTFTNTPLVDGYFNVILGPTDTNGANISTAFDAPERYVEITHNGNKITPRQRILSAPYALTVDATGVQNTLKDDHLEPVIDREGFNASGDISAGGNLTASGNLIGGHRRKVSFPGNSTDDSLQWTVPAGVKRIYVYAVGAGGGGGGGSAYSDDWAGGGGGAGGDYSCIPIDVDESYTIDITVGKGGEGGNSGEYGDPGTAGGATVIIVKDNGGNEIHKMVADGGGGGKPGRESSMTWIVTSSLGNGSFQRLIDAAGGRGGAPHGSMGGKGGAKIGGDGAHSLFGTGGPGGGSISGGDYNGYPGGPGAGGGGAYESSGGRKGGNGGDGYVEIYY